MFKLFIKSDRKENENLMSIVEFDSVSKSFGRTKVLHDINLKINEGEVVVIIGPSGSGKSTLLRCINKLEDISSGTLLVAGHHMTDPQLNECEIRKEAGMVFQQFHLFPHLTALENVMFGPIKVRKKSKSDAQKIARELLAQVGLYLHVKIIIHLNFQVDNNNAWRLQELLRLNPK